MAQDTAEMEDDFRIVPSAEPLPRQFGKYTLLRKLAAGGMAELFLALHRSVAGFEKLIVIKCILPSMNHDRGFIDMLLHEARVAATLSHPNIVQIFDVGQIDGKYFIAMEHIHGEDIRSIVRAMRRKRVAEFPLEHAIAIALGTCAGLAYAHERRDIEGNKLDIVHRDISPQNIIITFTGDVKVVDFGIAKSGSREDDTKDGQLKGKVPYMSPEQAAGEHVDWRTDIFATGVMLFELTTGKRLFKGKTEYETLKLICEREYPYPSEVRPGYPPGLEPIVMKALAKRREDRYQSAREMQADLEAFVLKEQIPVSTVSLMHWMQSLFEENLARQKEALQDIKQLADIIAAQQTERAASISDGSQLVPLDALMRSGTTTPTVAPAAPAPPARGGAGGIFAAAIGAALVTGAGLFYAQGRARDVDVEERARLSTAAGSAARADEATGALTIETQPEGCAVWIDGDLRPERTPATIRKLSLHRPIEVKLTKEGFEPYRDTITLGSPEPARIAAELKAGSVSVTLRIEPPPTVWVDGALWKGPRDRIDGLSADEEHRVVVGANGYLPKTFVFRARQGETKSFIDRLQRADPSAIAAGSSSATTETTAAGPAIATSTALKDLPVAASAPARVRVGAKGGFCNVTVNGIAHGPTPVEAVVPPGTARVVCKPETGPALFQSVKVGPGEIGRVAFRLEGE